MAKTHGLGAQIYFGVYDLSNDTQSVGKIGKKLNHHNMTGIDKYAPERQAGQLDAEISWTSFMNATNAHLALSPRTRGDVLVSYWHRATLGVPVASIITQQINYDPKRDNKGALTIDVQALANAYWLDWGLALTAGKRTDTTATNGTGVDFGDPTPAAFNFGLQTYLQVFAFTGTSAAIKLQESSDNGGTDAWADVTGGAFASVTAPTTEMLRTSRTQTVERYLRVITSGTFTSLQFAVSATVNITSYVI
jgi:hypothetical protein